MNHISLDQMYNILNALGIDINVLTKDQIIILFEEIEAITLKNAAEWFRGAKLEYPNEKISYVDVAFNLELSAAELQPWTIEV